MTNDRHFTTLLSIRRSPEAPSASGERLRAAEGAGLCYFTAWPSGCWHLTSEGVAVLDGEDDCDGEDV